MSMGSSVRSESGAREPFDDNLDGITGGGGVRVDVLLRRGHGRRNQVREAHDFSPAAAAEDPAARDGAEAAAWQQQFAGGQPRQLSGNRVSARRLLFWRRQLRGPAAEVPVALRQRYQYANITLVVGEEPDCSNRKIAKLVKMADRAEKAEVFVLSDADVSVERDYLKRIVGELIADEKIGIVTCAYRARPGGSFASRLEALYVNTDFLPQILLAEMIEPMHYALGATIAIKRQVLEAAGGFRAVKNMLADDFYLGNFTNAQGYEIKLSDSLVTLTCEEKSFRRVLEPSAALGAHLPHRAPDQHRDHPDAWPVLGAGAAADFARQRGGLCDVGAGRRGAPRDVGGDCRHACSRCPRC